MDFNSLLEKLNNFEVSNHANNPYAEHPHYSLYKSKRSGSSQEERRKKILDARKESRYDLLAHLRSIEENIPEDEFLDNEINVDEQKAVYRKPRQYKNFVMLSEWLVDVPQDFTENYLAVPCPVGKRCLCVCYRGWTSIYSKNGIRIQKFPSLLPGGSRKSLKYGYTVLDCIYSEMEKVFYILDMVFWFKYSYMECDTSFRFAWLKSRIDEYELDVGSISSINAFVFKLIPYFQCDKSSLKNMFNHPFFNETTLDGILFYHKDSHYTHGPSPLICWLKAYMLPEILGVEAPLKYMEEKPIQYTDINSHIVQYNVDEKIRRESNFKKNSRKEEMEVCSASPPPPPPPPSGTSDNAA